MRKTACLLAMTGMLGYFTFTSHAKDDDKKVTVTGVLIDKHCGDKLMDKEHPERDAAKDTKECAQMEACEKSGYVVIHDKEMIKLDEKGDRLAKDFLKTTNRTDHLMVTVEGERDGDVLKVHSLTKAPLENNGWPQERSEALAIEGSLWFWGER